jgi:hypothetical protein
MRKIALVFLASVALFSTACGGGGGSDKKTNAGADVNAHAGINSAAAAAAASKMCDSRAAVAFAATAASNAANSAGNNFKSMADTLRADAAAAPSEIKADFTLIANTEGAYLDVMASHNGDYMAVAQDPNAMAKLQALGNQDFKTAVDHIDAYFAQHCKG